MSCSNTEGAQLCRSGLARGLWHRGGQGCLHRCEGFLQSFTLCKICKERKLGQQMFVTRVSCCGGFFFKAVVLFENIQKQCFLSRFCAIRIAGWLMSWANSGANNISCEQILFPRCCQLMCQSHCGKIGPASVFFSFDFQAPTHPHCFGISV